MDEKLEYDPVMVKVLHLIWGNPKQKCNLGGDWTESPEKKDLGLLVDRQLKQHEQVSVCTCSPETQPGCIKKCNQQVKEGDPVSLLHIQLCGPQHKKGMDL